MSSKCLDCKWWEDRKKRTKEIWHCLSCTRNPEPSDMDNFEESIIDFEKMGEALLKTNYIEKDKIREILDADYTGKSLDAELRELIDGVAE